jgi:hypothetical protein
MPQPPPTHPKASQGTESPLLPLCCSGTYTDTLASPPLSAPRTNLSLSLSLSHYIYIYIHIIYIHMYRYRYRWCVVVVGPVVCAAVRNATRLGMWLSLFSAAASCASEMIDTRSPCTIPHVSIRHTSAYVIRQHTPYVSICHTRSSCTMA